MVSSPSIDKPVKEWGVLFYGLFFVSGVTLHTSYMYAHVVSSKYTNAIFFFVTWNSYMHVRACTVNMSSK